MSKTDDYMKYDKGFMYSVDYVHNSFRFRMLCPLCGCESDYYNSPEKGEDFVRLDPAKNAIKCKGCNVIFYKHEFKYKHDYRKIKCDSCNNELEKYMNFCWKCGRKVQK